MVLPGHSLWCFLDIIIATPYLCHPPNYGSENIKPTASASSFIKTRHNYDLSTAPPARLRDTNMLQKILLFTAIVSSVARVGVKSPKALSRSLATSTTSGE